MRLVIQPIGISNSNCAIGIIGAQDGSEKNEIMARANSFYNWAACEGILDLGNPDCFLYVITSFVKLQAYFFDIESLNFDCERVMSLTLISHLAARAADRVNAIEHDKFLFYGEYTGETSNESVNKEMVN